LKRSAAEIEDASATPTLRFVLPAVHLESGTIASSTDVVLLIGPPGSLASHLATDRRAAVPRRRDDARRLLLAQLLERDWYLTL
jgi:ATP-dependent helicase YprA (DUF1998 family)